MLGMVQLKTDEAFEGIKLNDKLDTLTWFIQINLFMQNSSLRTRQISWRKLQIFI